MMKTITTTLLLSVATLFSQVCPADWAADDFESNSFSGGTGNWTSNWTQSGGGGAFVNNNLEIDDTYAGALFTAGTGVQTLTRTFTTLDLIGEEIVVSFAMKGLAGSTEIGVNLIGQKSDMQSVIATFKFTGNGTGFTIDDGGGNSVVAPGITYNNGDIYQVAFTGIIGSADYDWGIFNRTSNTFDFNSDTYNNGATLSTVSAIQFFWDAPGGVGNDGLIDSVSIIPEPSSLLLCGLAVAAGFLSLRRRRT